MTLPDLTKSYVCASRAHCRRCRQLERGRPWRRVIAGKFNVTDAPDFACPFGVPWAELTIAGESHRPAPASPPPAPASPWWRTMGGLGDVVAAASSAIGIKPCAKCKKRAELLNAIVPNPFATAAALPGSTR